MLLRADARSPNLCAGKIRFSAHDWPHTRWRKVGGQEVADQYPAWLVPITYLLNLFVLLVEAVVLSIVNRKASLISDIYISSQRDAFSMLKIVRPARYTAMQSRAISFSTFFGAFTLVPQKLRLILSAGVPKS